jgi:hypothetical protein
MPCVKIHSQPLYINSKNRRDILRCIELRTFINSFDYYLNICNKCDALYTKDKLYRLTSEYKKEYAKLKENFKQFKDII